MDGLLRPDIPHSGRNAMAGGPPQPPIPISVVPDVVGRKQANAEAALQAAGLAVGSVTSLTGFDSSDGGKGMTQSLNPGLNVPAGTTANLMIGQWSGRNR